MTLYAIIETVLYILIKLLLITKNGAHVALNLFSLTLSIPNKIAGFIAFKFIKNLQSLLPLTFIKKFPRTLSVNLKSSNCNNGFPKYRILSSLHSAGRNSRRNKLKDNVAITAYYFHIVDTSEDSDSKISEGEQEMHISEQQEGFSQSSEIQYHNQNNPPENMETSSGNGNKMTESEDNCKGSIKRKAGEIETCLSKRKKSSNNSQPQDAPLPHETVDSSGGYNKETENTKDEDYKNRVVTNTLSKTYADIGIQCKFPIPLIDQGVQYTPEMVNKKVQTKSDLQTSAHSKLKEVSTKTSEPSNVHISTPEIKQSSSKQSDEGQMSSSSFKTPEITAVTGGQVLDCQNKENIDTFFSKRHDNFIIECLNEIEEKAGCWDEELNDPRELAKIERNFHNLTKSDPSYMKAIGIEDIPNASPPGSVSKDSPLKDSSDRESTDSDFMEPRIDSEEESPEEEFKSKHSLSEFYNKNPNLKDLTDRLEFYAESIKSMDIADMLDINTKELWRKRLQKLNSTSSPDKKKEEMEFDAFVCGNNSHVGNNIIQTFIASVSPIKSRNINYKPYPGLTLDPSKVKKDARYQKKFYKLKKSTVLNDKTEDDSKQSKSASSKSGSEQSQTPAEALLMLNKDFENISPVENSERVAEISKLTDCGIEPKEHGSSIPELNKKSPEVDGLKTKDIPTEKLWSPCKLNNKSYLSSSSNSRDLNNNSAVNTVPVSSEPEFDSDRVLDNLVPSSRMPKEYVGSTGSSCLSKVDKSVTENILESGKLLKTAQIIPVETIDLKRIPSKIPSDEQAGVELRKLNSEIQKESFGCEISKKCHEKDAETGESSVRLDHNVNLTEREDSESKVRTKCDSLSEIEISKISEFVLKKLKLKRSRSVAEYNVPLEDKSVCPLEIDFSTISCGEDNKKKLKTELQEWPVLNEKVNFMSTSTDKTSNELEEKNMGSEMDTIEQPCTDENISENIVSLSPKKKISKYQLNVKDKASEMEYKVSELSKNASEPAPMSKNCDTQSKLELKVEKFELDEQNTTDNNSSIHPKTDSGKVSCENLSFASKPGNDKSIKIGTNISNGKKSSETLLESGGKSHSESDENTVEKNESDMKSNKEQSNFTPSALDCESNQAASKDRQFSQDSVMLPQDSASSFLNIAGEQDVPITGVTDKSQLDQPILGEVVENMDTNETITPSEFDCESNQSASKDRQFSQDSVMVPQDSASSFPNIAGEQDVPKTGVTDKSQLDQPILEVNENMDTDETDQSF